MKLIEMSTITQNQLYEVIENAHLDLNVLNDQMRYLICKAASPEQWIRATELFLRSCGSRHTIPGLVIFKLTGICQDYKDHGTITLRQQMFVTSKLIDHWDQLGVEMRATILA